MLPVRKDENMKQTKDDIYSLLGTVIFHLIIFLILWFTVLRTVVPEEEEGILVNFGNLNAAAGTFEPRYTGQELPKENITPPPTPTPVAKTPKEELITQEEEETVSLTDAKKKEEERKREEEKKRKEEAEKERIRKEETERKRLAEEQRKREEAISNRVAGAFGIGQAEGTSQGDATEGAGNQGSPFGNSDKGANEGVGGYGSFNLNGRSIGAGGLPRPSYTIQEEGKIVINITVDPKGNVIFTEIGRGTNIDNASMRKSALDAARRAKFNSINGTNNQSGTITYLYKLK
ncbi:TonB family protein [Parabacteroides sp. PM5-20]|nr:TonB family protein [Parabacteroides sp. PM5-20]